MEGGIGARWRDEELIDKFADKLVSQLESLTEKQQPFFLYYAPSHPHIGSHSINGNAHWPNARFKGTSQAGNYGDVVQELDWSIGIILDNLDRLGLTENTLVIFASDNGGYNRDFHGHRPNGLLLRGGKGALVAFEVVMLYCIVFLRFVRQLCFVLCLYYVYRCVSFR